MTKVIKPIIIVGTGRCGSTLFHTLLTKHEQVMWLNGLAKMFTKDRWREDLALGQQAILDEVLRDDLQRYGYDDDGAHVADMVGKS